MGIIALEDMIKKGKWIITLNDKSKWVVDFDNNSMDSLEWYKAYGTLENELNYDDLKKDAVSMRKLK